MIYLTAFVILFLGILLGFSVCWCMSPDDDCRVEAIYVKPQEVQKEKVATVPIGHEWVISHYKYNIKTDIENAIEVYYAIREFYLNYSVHEDDLKKTLKEIEKKNGKVTKMERAAVRVLKHTERVG